MIGFVGKGSLIYIFMSMFICLNAANLTINTTNQRLAISPYIYGLNQQLNGDENITVMRLGGNRMTGYNWENNASNAGTDWQNSSDDYMCGAYNVDTTDCTNKAGAVYEAFVNYNLARNYDSLVTIPMAGYVAADKSGDVTWAQTAPSSRWHPIIYSKGSAFSYPPNTADDAVYMDESVWHLTQDYGLAGSPTGVKFYMLDNEPGIWNSTHPCLHPLTPTCVEYVNDSTNLGKAIKNVDPNSMVFGGVYYGWSDYMTFNAATDWGTQGAGYNWFVSYYLKKMKDAETANGGKRILDDIDFHYYSEATNGTCRITDNNCAGYPTNANTERMNATRTLYDAAYRENSWIGQWYPQFIPLIPLIISSINTYYPGTKFSFSEWNFGAGKYISGGLADVDTLGIFGKYGAYLATMWSVDEGGYSSSAFKMYRNYDGSNSTFGNTSVEADTDTNTMTVYASINGNDVSQLHLIVVNKFPTTQTANITITSPEAYSSMQVYGFDQTSYTITARSSVLIAANSFAYSMPAYSTMHFILSSNVTPTNTPNWTATPTYTRTQTFTITPTFTSTPIAASVIIYDGDTAGAAIADGTINSTAPGVMSQTTGGDPGNMMKLTYTTVTGWWEQHSWVLNNPKSTAGEMYLTFNVRQDPSSANAVVQFDVGLNTGWSINLDVSNYLVGGGAVTTAWKTVMIPLSALVDAGQATVNYIAFTDNFTDDYTVDIDNVMLVPAVATPTPTSQYSLTLTQTYTQTSTPTSSRTQTLTRTPSFTPTFTTTYSYTQTFTQTLFVTATVTPSVTATITGTPPTVTDTPTITWTYTYTATVTMTATPTTTWTLQPTKSFTQTLTATPTFTQTFTRTITPDATFTFTPTLSATPALPSTPTLTPTALATTGQPGIKVVIYPDPIIAGKDPLNMLIAADQKPDSVKLRIYTASFRLIHEATWDSSGITGSYVVTEGADKFANLGSGSYYFVVFVTDQQGRVTRSKAGPLIILR